MQLGAMAGNPMVYSLKVGERSDPLGSCQSRAKPRLKRPEGVETGWVMPKGQEA